MKRTDRIRRFFFIISTEGASLYEWSIWSILLALTVGFPAASLILDDVLKGLFIFVITALFLFFISFAANLICDSIIANWPFMIGDDELEFEQNYTPRIPVD